MQTVLLTGTSSGIGEAAARRFLDEGWNVVAAARNSTAAAPGPDHSSLLRVRMDVTDPTSIEAAFKAAEAHFGGIDVVVNNAGVGLGGPLEAIPLDRLRDHLEVNLIGVVAVSQAAIPYMRRRKTGLILNVSSLAGRVGLPFLTPYSASKFAVEGFTEALHYELKPFGIRVKLIAPGGVRTRFAHPWVNHDSYPAAERVRLKMEAGSARSAPATVAAQAIFAAANDPSDRLRYTATDAGLALRLRRLLPDGLWRKLITKSFDLRST